MADNKFGWSNFAIRFAFALILVAATYNPEGYSYIHWAFSDLGAFSALKALAGLALIIGWTVYLRATMRSLGPIGLGLAIAVFGCLVWVLIDYGLLSMESTRAISYVGIVIVAAVMAIGMSWSYVRRRMSGQMDVDDVEE